MNISPPTASAASASAIQVKSILRRPAQPNPMPKSSNTPLPASLTTRTVAAIPNSHGVAAAASSVLPMTSVANTKAVEEHYLDNLRTITSSDGAANVSFTLRQLAQFIHSEFLIEHPDEAKKNIYMINASGLWHFHHNSCPEPLPEESVTLSIFTEFDRCSLFQYIEKFLSTRIPQCEEEVKQEDPQEVTTASFIIKKSPLRALNGTQCGMTELLTSNIRIKIYFGLLLNSKKASGYPISSTSQYSLHWQFDPAGTEPSSLSIFKGNRWDRSFNHEDILNRKYEIYIDNTLHPFIVILHEAINGWTPIQLTNLLKCLQRLENKYEHQQVIQSTIMGHAGRGAILFSLRNFLAIINSINTPWEESRNTVNYFLDCYIRFLPGSSILKELINIIKQDSESFRLVLRITQLIVINEHFKKIDGVLNAELEQKNLFLSNEEKKCSKPYLDKIIKAFNELKIKHPLIIEEIPEQRINELCDLVLLYKVETNGIPSNKLKFISNLCWNYLRKSSEPIESEGLIEIYEIIQLFDSIKNKPVDDLLLKNIKINYTNLLKKSSDRYSQMEVDDKFEWVIFLENCSYLEPEIKESHLRQLLSPIPSEILLESAYLTSLLAFHNKILNDILLDKILKLQLKPEQEVPSIYAVFDELRNYPQYHVHITHWIEGLFENDFKLSISSYWLQNINQEHQVQQKLQLVLDSEGLDNREIIEQTINQELNKLGKIHPKLLEIIKKHFAHHPTIYQILFTNIHKTDFLFSKAHSIFGLIAELHPPQKINIPALDGAISRIHLDQMGSYFPYIWQLRQTLPIEEESSYQKLFSNYILNVIKSTTVNRQNLQFFIHSFQRIIKQDVSTKQYLKLTIELLIPQFSKKLGPFIETWMTRFPIDDEGLLFMLKIDPIKALKHINRAELNLSFNACLALTSHIQKDTPFVIIEKVFALLFNAITQEKRMGPDSQLTQLQSRVHCLVLLFSATNLCEEAVVLKSQCELLKEEWKVWLTSKEAVNAFAHYTHLHRQQDMIPAWEFYLSDSPWHGLDFIIRTIELFNEEKQFIIANKAISLFIQLPEEVITHNHLRYNKLFVGLYEGIKLALEKKEERITLLSSLSNLSNKHLEMFCNPIFEHLETLKIEMFDELLQNKTIYSFYVILKVLKIIACNKSRQAWTHKEIIQIGIVFEELFKKILLLPDIDSFDIMKVKGIYELFEKSPLNEIKKFNITFLQEKFLNLFETKIDFTHIPKTIEDIRLFKILCLFNFKSIINNANQQYLNFLKQAKEKKIKLSLESNVRKTCKWMLSVLSHLELGMINSALFNQFFKTYGNLFILETYIAEFLDKDKGVFNEIALNLLEKGFNDTFDLIKDDVVRLKESIQTIESSTIDGMFESILSIGEEKFPESISKILQLLVEKNCTLTIIKLKTAYDLSKKQNFIRSKKQDFINMFQAIRSLPIFKDPQQNLEVKEAYCWLEVVSTPLTAANWREIQAQISTESPFNQFTKFIYYYLAEIRENQHRDFVVANFLKNPFCLNYLQNYTFKLLLIREEELTPIIFNKMIIDLKECWKMIQSRGYHLIENKQTTRLDITDTYRNLADLGQFVLQNLSAIKNLEEKLELVNLYFQHIELHKSNIAVIYSIIQNTSDLINQILLPLFNISHEEHITSFIIYKRIFQNLNTLLIHPSLARNIYIAITDIIIPCIIEHLETNRISLNKDIVIKYYEIFYECIVFIKENKKIPIIEPEIYMGIGGAWIKIKSMGDKFFPSKRDKSSPTISDKIHTEYFEMKEFYTVTNKKLYFSLFENHLVLYRSKIEQSIDESFVPQILIKLDEVLTRELPILQNLYFNDEVTDTALHPLFIKWEFMQIVIHSMIENLPIENPRQNIWRIR